jgi:hypothetical protein
VGAGDLPRDHGEGTVALAAPLGTLGGASSYAKTLQDVRDFQVHLVSTGNYMVGPACTLGGNNKKSPVGERVRLGSRITNVTVIRRRSDVLSFSESIEIEIDMWL